MTNSLESSAFKPEGENPALFAGMPLYSGQEMVTPSPAETQLMVGGTEAPLSLTQQDFDRLAVLSFSGQVRPFGVELGTPVGNTSLNTQAREAASREPKYDKFQESDHVRKRPATTTTSLIWNPHAKRDVRMTDD